VKKNDKFGFEQACRHMKAGNRVRLMHPGCEWSEDITMGIRQVDKLVKTKNAKGDKVLFKNVKQDEVFVSSVKGDYKYKLADCDKLSEHWCLVV